MSELEFIQGFPSLNVYLWQRLDPVLYFLQGPGILQNEAFLKELTAGIFVAGLFLAFFLSKNQRNIKDKILIKKLARSALSTFALTLALYFIFTDTLFSSGLTYFSFLLAALVFIRRNTPQFDFEKRHFNLNFVYFVPLLIAGVFWTMHAGALAILGLLISYIFGALYLKIADSKFNFLYLCFFLSSLLTLPSLVTNPYPKGAKLVSKELFNLGEKSLFSSSLNAPFVEFAEYQSILLNITVGFALILTGLLLIRLAFSKKHSLPGLGSLGALFLLCLSEYLLAKRGFSHSFFSILSEIIPGLNQKPLFWLFLLLCLILIFFNILKNASSNFLAALSILIAASLYIRNSYFPETILSLNKNIILKKDYKNLSFQNKALYSPSNPALNSHGLWAASPKAYLERYFKNLNKITENETGTWQQSNAQNTIEVKFDNPVTLIKVALEPLERKTVIPKSIRVEGLAEESSSWQVLQEAEPWIGPLRWSQDSGVFLGDKSKIIIDLPKPEKLKGIRFIESSNNALLDYKVRLYGPK